MKIEHGFKKLEEAKDRAKKLLAEGSRRRKKTFYGRTEEGDVYHSIEFMEEGSIAFVFPVGESFSLYALTTEEADPKNFTFPFRNLLKEDLFYPISMGAVHRRPSKALTTSEAQTPTGAETLYSFLPSRRIPEFCTDREKVKNCIHDDIFPFDDSGDEDDDSDDNGVHHHTPIKLAPLPSLLSEDTGLTIRNEEEYLAALIKHLWDNRENDEYCKEAAITGYQYLAPYDLLEREKRAIRGGYLLRNEILFIRYLVYELARTEDYGNLQENLEKYPDFGLTEERFFQNLEGKKWTEELVLRCYVASSARSKIATYESLQDIAEKLGVSYEKLLKVERGKTDYAI